MMTSITTHDFLKACSNIISYPFRDGVAYDPNTMISTQRMQETASLGLAMAGAVFGAQFGATISFASASAGYLGGHYAVGAIVDRSLNHN